LKRKMSALVAGFALLGVLTACSGEGLFDPGAVEATLTTKPEPVLSGSPAELLVSFTGLKAGEKASVTFDIRVGDKPKLVAATNRGNGEFGGTFTFPEKGSYTVYIHLYSGDLHLTKMKTIEVQ